jgi:putative ABC transport system permease protein
MPTDMPLATQSSPIAIPLKVKAIISDDQFGRYSLKNNQTAPLNVFLPLNYLDSRLELDRRANTLLVKQRQPVPLRLDILTDALKSSFRLSDAGYQIRFLPDLLEIELTSDRIFIEDRVGEIALRCGANAEPVLTYFVNQIRDRDRVTPYSFVAGIDPHLFHPSLKKDEIVINAWTAQDLNAKIGDRIELSYYVIDLSHRLKENSTAFKIANIMATRNRLTAQSLVPPIPGLVDVENCRDWDSTLPIDLKRIRMQDEKYWNQYKTLPKACISVYAAQEIWQNRYGNLTSIQYPSSLNSVEKLETEMLSQITPAYFDLIFQPVREQGLTANQEAVDFGQLFTSLSFFVIISALLLTSLLFVFNIEQRSSETGLLLAVGISRLQVRQVLMFEGFTLAIIGSVVGGGLGFIYHSLVFWGLSTFWQDAIGGATLYFTVRPVTVILGIISGFAVACIAMGVTIRNKVRYTIRDLQNAGTSKTLSFNRKNMLFTFIISFVGITAALGVTFFTDVQKNANAISMFFVAGILLLVSGIFLSRVFFSRLSARIAHSFGMMDLMFRNLTRRPAQSLTIVSLFACGIFVIFSVGANRQNAVENADKKSSGTGGFAFWGETSMPVSVERINPQKQKDAGFFDSISVTHSLVPIRVRDGDDASCLNLNHVKRPRIIGIDPQELAKRNAFSFTKTIVTTSMENPWLLLEHDLEPNTIPAIVDQTVLQWGLKKTLGDTLYYRNESGHPIYLKIVGALANSVFQGNLIISESNFIRQFPSTNGYRLFLLDVPVEKRHEVSEKLLWSLQDLGLELTPTGVRLNSFNNVQNTYLSIFLALGGLGLILGSIGMIIVLLRNVAERRSELAVLKAVGWEAERISHLLILEHILLLIMGTVIGVFSSLVAIRPALTFPGNKIPWGFMLLLLTGILLCGILSTIVAAHGSQRTNLLSALRNE